MNIIEEKEKHQKEIEHLTQQINQLEIAKNQIIAQQNQLTAQLLKYQGVIGFLEQMEKEAIKSG